MTGRFPLLWCLWPCVVALTLTAACSAVPARESQAVERLTNGGKPDAGRAAIRKYGCYTCHTIEGVTGANGQVGPKLSGLRDRLYIAGHLPNTPENLMSWIQHPHAVEPRTVMPEMNVTEEDSRNIAAYLYTLR